MKKKKKTKKKINKRRICSLLFLSFIIIAVIFILNTVSQEPKLSGAMSALDKFMSYINDGEYEQMYEMLSESSKANVTKEDFISKNEEIYDKLEVSLVSVSNMKEEEENRKDKNLIYKPNGDHCGDFNFW